MDQTLGSNDIGTYFLGGYNFFRSGWIVRESQDRHHDVLTFRLTQFLIGHGYFGRVRQGVTTVWTALEDTWSIRWSCAPLGWSTAVSSWRRSAVDGPGTDHRSRGGIEAVASFCEAAMLAKEKAERLTLPPASPDDRTGCPG